MAMEERVTRRAASATFTEASNAVMTERSVANRKSATVIEATVRIVRRRLWKRLRQMSRRNFIGASTGRSLVSRAPGRPCRDAAWRARARAACGSWVTITMVFLNSVLSRSSRSRISSAALRVEVAGGLVGDEQVGSVTMARAMATRCSCPPESWRG